MGNRISTGSLKRSLLFTTLGCRALVIAAVLACYGWRRVTSQELNRLLETILPLTVVYIAFLLRYTIHHRRYFAPGPWVSRAYGRNRLWPIVLLHVLELVLLFFKNTLSEESVEPFFAWIAMAECGLAVLAGFALSVLFTVRENSPG